MTRVVDRTGWIVAAFAAIFLVATLPEPLRMNWGDPWTDSNAQNDGRAFATHGFVKLAFTPVIDIEPLTPESLRYTHYPPLPDILNGMLQRLFGPLDISVFRVPAIGLSLVALLLFFRFVTSVWGRSAANFALAFFAGNFLWLQYADTIHHIPIFWATGFGALVCTVRWIATQKKKYLAAVGGLTFLCFLASYDYVFFLPLMVGVTAILLRQPLWAPSSRRLFGTVLVGGTLAVVVKYALVIWAVGWPQVYADLIFQFHERATSKYGGDYESGFALILVYRLWRFYTPLFFAVVALQMGLLVLRAVAPKRAKQLAEAKWTASPLLVLAAGAPFILVFSELFAEQYHPTLVLLPYYAISAGVLVGTCWESPKRSLKAVGMALLAFGLAWQLRELAIFEKTFLSRDDIARVDAVLREKDDQRFVLSNGVMGAPFMFYWNRYELGISYIPPEFLPRYITSLLDQFGGSSLRYVHFVDIEKSFFDKYLYGRFAPEQKWEWIANPTAHKEELEASLRLKDQETSSYLAQFADEELNTGTVQVWRVDRTHTERFLSKKVMAEPTTSIDFGDRSSEIFKVYGFRYPERYGTVPGFCWTERRQPRRFQFTLKGLLYPPSGSPTDDAALLLNLPPGKSYRVELSLIASLPGQAMRVSLNGSPTIVDVLLRKSGEPEEATFDIPEEVLNASGLQVLRFELAKVNAYGLGVAFRTLRVTPK